MGKKEVGYYGLEWQEAGVERLLTAQLTHIVASFTGE